MKYSVCLLISIFALCSCSPKKAIDWVNPFIGTGGHGHTHPGALRPFGMVQVGPDTRLDGWDGCSGYHYSDSIIYGFSHTHLSGTGCLDYGDILLMPVSVNPVAGNVIQTNCASGFRHSNEKSQPGYYQVFLEKDQINCELTATPRCGLHKYTYTNNSKYIYLDLKHRDETIESHLKIVNNNEIEGYRRSKAWATDQIVYFVIRFSEPIVKSHLLKNDSLFLLTDHMKGKNLKAVFEFEGEKKEVLVQCAISGTGIEGARKNLNAELSDFNFERIKKEAQNDWQKELSKIEVEGGSETDKTNFYSSLYHVFSSPNLYSDVDGKYLGRDKKIHQANGFDYYTVFSLWDTYRTFHPLMTIIDQKRTNDFIKTFLAQYEQGGALPVWELSSNETGCMIGYHSVSVIADAFAKGIRNYNPQLALKAMVNSAMQDHLGLKEFREQGIISADKEHESVSKVLEYAYDDWCIAQMAIATGNDSIYRIFIKRAQHWKNVFDPQSKFMRAKSQGIWFTPFQPEEVNFNYTEANAWQYSFAVPQDISSFIEFLGGKDSLAKKLDLLFTANSQTKGRNQADITGLIGQYAHGNEPSHHMAYLYNFASQPWKTQQRVREIMNTMYHNDPDGLCGNEDCGQMSAWYVMSAMGFYPLTPGKPEYVIGSPIFDKVTIHLENGKKTIIEAQSQDKDHIYIQQMNLNGKEHNSVILTHDEIMSGAHIEFTMGSSPNTLWGTKAPDYKIIDELLLPSPYIYLPMRTFFDSVKVVLGCADSQAQIYYTLNGKEPEKTDLLYTKPFTISKSSQIRIKAFKGNQESYMTEGSLIRIPEKRSITLAYNYAPQYTGGSANALIDYIDGGNDYRTGTWQGFEGVDIDAVVELPENRNIHQISIQCLQDNNAWVFYPLDVEFFVSQDGKQYTRLGKQETKIGLEKEGVHTQIFAINKPTKNIKFVRVLARNTKTCPVWHKGAGNKAWIFADEIKIK